MHKKYLVAIIGPLPPPHGGISIHLKRFSNFLKKNRIGHTIFNTSTNHFFKKIFLDFILFNTYDLYHFHCISIKKRLFIGFMGFLNKKVILSIHGDSLATQFSKLNILQKKINIFFLKKINIFIVVNSNIKKKLIELSISSKKIFVVSSFIPPDTKLIRETIDPHTNDFIVDHSPIVLANASRITLMNGVDLYGIDLLIELCTNLKKKYPKIGFILCVPQIGNRKYFNSLKSIIAKKNISSSIHFQHREIQMYPLFQHADLFIRPTNQDGYGISVAEAIHSVTPAIASDVCPRADGTILFKNRNYYDLEAKTCSVLKNLSKYRIKIDINHINNTSDKILRLYIKLLNNKI